MTTIQNPSFETESGGVANSWSREGHIPRADVGTGSGAIDPRPYWEPPDGDRVDVFTAIEASSAFGHSADLAEVLGAGDAAYAGAFTKGAWLKYIIPDSVVVTVGGVPVGADDGLGQITGTGISDAWIDYFTGEYAITITGTGGAAVALSGQERYPSFHTASRSAFVLGSPRGYDFLRFYRKVEVPSSPPIPAGVMFLVEVEFDDGVRWSVEAQAGDEGLLEEGEVSVRFGELSSDPRVVYSFTLDTGLQDGLLVDDGRRGVELFRYWSEYYQAEPVADDTALTFDDGAVTVEGFVYWHEVLQAMPTLVALSDPLDWGGSGTAGADLNYPDPSVKGLDHPTLVIAGENQPQLVHDIASGLSQAYGFYRRVTGDDGLHDNFGVVWGGFVFCVSLNSGGSALACDVKEWIPGSGNPGSRWEFATGASLGAPGLSGSEDVTRLYGVKFIGYGNEFRVVAAEVPSGDLVEIGHWVFSPAEPLVVYRLQTKNNASTERIVLTQPPSVGSGPGQHRIVAYSPATGPGGSYAKTLYWSD